MEHDNFLNAYSYWKTIHLEGKLSHPWCGYVCRGRFVLSFLLRGRLRGAHAPSAAGTATFRRLHRSSHISAGEHKREGWKPSIIRDMRRSRPRPRPRGPAPWGTIGSPRPRRAAGWCSPAWRGAAARSSARQAAERVSPGRPRLPLPHGAPAEALTYPHGRADPVQAPVPCSLRPCPQPRWRLRTPCPAGPARSRVCPQPRWRPPPPAARDGGSCLWGGEEKREAPVFWKLHIN